ncbi:MAG: membrane integrity-associated transporter subunit PqiC [Burkholderiales bacterium]|nr:membrane integrity-associated transporter subunit PqiC [Burkholderiales bacterium]
MGAVLCAALVAGCASTPPSRYYTLSGAAAAQRPAAGPAVAVGPVTIPAVVDRPEIVVTVGDHEVWLDEFNRWAAPLSDNIALAVAENLTAKLNTSRVTLYATTALAQVQFQVTIDVQRFESAPGSHALLDAVYTVRRLPDGATASGRTTVRETVADRGYDALAAAHSRALGRLSADVAGAIGTMEAVPAAASPSPR